MISKLVWDRVYSAKSSVVKSVKNTMENEEVQKYKDIYLKIKKL